MAWIEKRERGRYRIRETIDGKSVTVVRNAGDTWELAEERRKDYERDRVRGVAPEPDKTIAAALDLYIASKRRNVLTEDKIRGAVTAFTSHAGATHVDREGFSVDKVNAWRDAMDKGTLRYTRGGKDGKTEITYAYAQESIVTRLGDLRGFCKYCQSRGWMTADPKDKARPINPFSQIVIAQPTESTERFLNREEAATFLRACRVDKYKNPGAPQLEQPIQAAILKIAASSPELGKKSIRRLLAEQGFGKVSDTGIDGCLNRHGLRLMSHRFAAKKRGVIPAVKAPTETVNPFADNRLRRIVLFGLYTGMRPGEVLRAEWDHLHCTEVLNGEHQLVVQYSIDIPKAKGKKRKRCVPLHPRLVRILGIPKRFGKIRGRIFADWNKHSLSQARQRAVKRSGLGRVRFQDLRHSFARNFLRSRAGDIAQLQKMLGHRRLATTGIYSHFSVEDLAVAVPKVRMM